MENILRNYSYEEGLELLIEKYNEVYNSKQGQNILDELWIAKNFNYEIKILGSEILFYKENALMLPKLRLLILQAMLRQPFFSVLKAIIFLIPAHGHITDHENGLRH